MRPISIIVAGVVLLAGNALAAPTAPAKPAYTFRSEFLEARVTIDPALKRFPGLSENLLAAGKRTVAKWNTAAEQDKRVYPRTFRDNRPHEYEGAYSERSVVGGRFVSVLRTEYIDTGGAHPNRDINTILWDGKTGKRVSIRPFFNDTAAGGPTLRKLAKAIRARLAIEKRARYVRVGNPDTDEWLSAVKPNLLLMGAMALAPSTEPSKSSGLIVYFSPYAVGSYAEGSYVVFLPWTLFKADLSEEGKRIFGGERPKGDDKDDAAG